jgi:hypothetical protein
VVGTPSTGWWGGGTPSTYSRERKTVFTGCGGDSIYRVVGRWHSIYLEREKLYTYCTWGERNSIFTGCGGDSINRMCAKFHLSGVADLR